MKKQSKSRSFTFRKAGSWALAAIGLVSGIVTMVDYFGRYLHRPSVATVSGPTMMVAVEGGSGATKLLPPEKRVQSSAIDAHRHAKVQRDPLDGAKAQGSLVNSNPVAPAFAAATGHATQYVYLSQSPVVSGVGGNVDIRYESGNPSKSEKSPVEAQ
jgi:hypothetical protein